MPPLEPFLLDRIVLPKVWGGRALADVLGIELPPGQAIGETWELFDRQEGSNRLRGSSRTLAQVLHDAGEQLVGRGVPLAHGGRFPLLLKFLDAREELSLQVHPDDAQAVGDSGKDECSIVLRVGPNGRIVRGLKPGVTWEQFAASAAGPGVEDLLLSFRPEVGDTIHLPPGTVHAIGPDVVIFEVQQNSDLTYRLYDWGRGREVHVNKALGVVRTDPTMASRTVVPPVALPDGGKLLIATDHFRVRRYATAQPVRLATGARFASVTLVAGAAKLGWPGVTAPLAMVAGDTALVPACQEQFVVTPVGHSDFMICDPGTR